MLLVYLLKHAGYKTQYIEGLCSLPASLAEQLLFMQFPEEQEILLNYPGVMFSDGQNWYSLFPWMKEIHTIEGRDLYSLMPEEYGNADRWLKRYLCNDENILKHIGPDGNDTVGVLFVRHLEECLRNQGLSLQDVGTQRFIQKKQFNAWDDFPRPVIKGEIQPSLNLPNRVEIFAKIKLTIRSEQNPFKKIELDNLNLSAFSLGSFAIRSEQILASLHKIAPSTHFCVGLSKLSPDRSPTADLRIPQVDMCNFYLTQNHNKHPFSAYQEPYLSNKYCTILTNADGSSNEHQVLREIYQDPMPSLLLSCCK